MTPRATREGRVPRSGCNQQVIGAQAARYAAAWDVGAGLARFRDWLQDHTAASREPDADQAVAQLYSLHYRPLVQLAALLVRDAATAEEVVQDAFAAMRGSPAGDAEKALAYLRQAVVNRSRSVLRHRAVAGDNPPQALRDTPGAEHEAPGLLEQPAARAALRDLPERQGEAIVLRYYAGLSKGRDRRRDGHQPRRGEQLHRPRAIRAWRSSGTGQLAPCPSPRQ